MEKTRQIGYIRVRKGGKSQSEQEKLLRVAGIDDFEKHGPVYIDKPKVETRSVRPVDLENREEMLKALRRGSVVVVADYATLGVSGEDWLYAVGQVAEAGASLLICDEGEHLEWPDASQAIAARLAHGASMARAALVDEKTAKARKARALSNAEMGRRPVDEEKVEVARGLWFNPDCDLSAQAIADKAGVGRMTLIRRFGPITQCRQKTTSK